MKKPVGRPQLNKLRPYPCGCGKTYMTTKELYEHYNNKHPPPYGPPKGSYKRKKVGRPVKNKSSMKQRVCGECGNVYSNVRSLSDHIRNKHGGNRSPNTQYYKAGRPKK